MSAKYILLALAIVLLLLALSRTTNQASGGAARTWLTIAGIFCAVSVLLFTLS
jgi:hypothetical protein